MDDVTLGRLLRAVRRRLGLRQVDVAARARVSQQTISVLECGRLDRVSVPMLRRVAQVLEVRVDVRAQWRGAAGARLLDAAHARLVELVVRLLRQMGFEVLLEYTFNHFGERGSVDIVAWHPTRRALLIVEVKSELVDTQELNSTLDRKVRLVPVLLARERGWAADSVGRLLVLPDRTAAREAVLRHRSSFAAALPGRNRTVRSWLREPVGPLAGILFLRDTSPSGAQRGGPQRVRVSRDPGQIEQRHRAA